MQRQTQLRWPGPPQRDRQCRSQRFADRVVVIARGPSQQSQQFVIEYRRIVQSRFDWAQSLSRQVAFDLGFEYDTDQPPFAESHEYATADRRRVGGVEIEVIEAAI